MSIKAEAATGAAQASIDQPQDNAAAMAASPVRAQDRIASLDFVRGIAVMGILAANIVSFGQPMSAYFWPGAFMVDPADPGGWQWVIQFVLVDGKMRGLFSLLFGAGLYLFMERAWARGSTRRLQMWRLAVLLGFGLLHFYFVWMGDILAMYGLVGFVALAFMGFRPGTQIRVGLFIYTLGAIFLGGVFTIQYLIADTAVFAGQPWAIEAKAEIIKAFETAQAAEAKITALTINGDYGGLIAERFSQQWWMPFTNPLFFGLETLPLMLLGMALYRLGFFSGGLDARRMIRWGWSAVIAGGAMTLAIALFVRSGGFTHTAVNAAFIGWSLIPRLIMTLGMAALLVELSKRVHGPLAQRVSAAGRAAFTNYLGTSILMMFVFQGWGLGLFGDLNRPLLYLVTVITCALMLAWSKPWLERFRYGPLEWLWRCLTYRRLFALRR